MAKHLEEKFKDYHKQNPEVYKLFKQFAQQAKFSGKTHYSANSIFERIRWHVEVETLGDRFELNNNYRPYYARKLMIDYPETFAGFFAVMALQEVLMI
tara:strand:+ start:1299 stop:1592 length:294 start_codon:yes stop_codon:yes gene_type:complete